MPNSPQPVQFHPMQSHRFHLLDGLRGLAAIAVVLFHMPFFLRPWLSFTNSWLAVDFFFCLSGFVIAFSYQARLSSGMRLRDFFAARIIRLYPLYLLGTALGLLSTVIVQSLSSHVRLSLTDIALSLPFALAAIPNLLNHWPFPYTFPLDVPAWSLFFEIAANLAFALLLRMRAGSTPVLLAVAGLSLFLLIIAARRGLPSLDVGSVLNTVPLGLPRVGYSFFIGALIFRAWRATTRPLPHLLRAWLFPSLASLGLLAILLASSRATLSIAWQFLVVTTLFPALVYLGAWSDLPRLLNRVCAFFGDVSYPLYILHAPLVFPLKGSKVEHFAATHSRAAEWIVPLLIPILLALAFFAGRYFDRDLRKWLSRRYNALAS